MRIAILPIRGSVSCYISGSHSLQLLSQSTSCFSRARGLDADDFNEVHDTSNVLQLSVIAPFMLNEVFLHSLRIARSSIDLSGP